MEPTPHTGLDTGPSTDLHPGERKAELPALRRDRVYQELRRQIMLGDYGSHARLVEERIATSLGVSRTPVREALLRLVADGLVRRLDGGYYVVTPQFADLRDLYDLRITLELRGLTRALEIDSVQHDESLLEPLRDQWRGLWTDRPEPTPDFVLVDEDFHVTLLRSAGNAALAASLETVNARIRSVRMYDFLDERRVELTIEQHLGVLEGVLSSRLTDALRALRAHVGESMEEVEGRAARALTQMLLHQGGPR